MKRKKAPINTRDYVNTEECGHRWSGQGETSMSGSHCCIKDPRHVGDITNDDHQCCCGAAE